MPQGGKANPQTIYNMSHFLSGFIHRLFIRYFSTKPPQNECVSYYIGKTTKEIICLHKDAIVNKQLSIIEIRLMDATLTCDIYKDICTDARLFRDKESLFDSVL